MFQCHCHFLLNFASDETHSRMKIIQFLLLIALGSRSSESYRILGLFPHPAISHFRAFQPLLVELATLGHEVVVVSHFPVKNAPGNYRDLVLDQSDIMTGQFSVDEVSEKRTTLMCFFADSLMLPMVSICNINAMTINVYDTKFMPQFVA